jgi:hypothetical protein
MPDVDRSIQLAESLGHLTPGTVEFRQKNRITRWLPFLRREWTSAGSFDNPLGS